MLRKRNKALRKIKKLIQKNSEDITEVRRPSTGERLRVFLKCSKSLFPPSADQKGLKDFFSQSTDDSDINLEELDLLKDLPFPLNWNSELPAMVGVPRVDIHSLILDFSAVSFMDISAMKGMKMVRNRTVAARGII